MNDYIDCIKLKNHYCALVPLTELHHNDLVDAATDGELWNLSVATIPTADTMRAEIKRRLELRAEGSMFPFAVIHDETQRAVGMTTYCKINITDQHLDIGWTWYAKSHQRTVLNTHCKLLLLTYAFETMKMDAVYFKVHVNNQRSHAAVLRLGARLIGVIKNYRTMPGKQAQDYHHYGVSKVDWPVIKQDLIDKARARN